MKDVYIAGISCFFHDSAAALIKNGKIIACAEEERFSRKKNDNSFPSKAIEYCLSEAEIDVSDVDKIVYYENPFKKAIRIIKTLSNIPHIEFKGKLHNSTINYFENKLLINHQIFRQIETNFGYQFPLWRIRYTSHHLSHAAASYYFSGFADSAVLCIDAVGEEETTTLWAANGKKLTLIKKIEFPHSIGLLYSTFTAVLGFRVNSGEYKVMGMAPYGENDFSEIFRKELVEGKGFDMKLNLSYFSYQDSGSMYSPNLLSFLRETVGTSFFKKPLSQIHFDIALSIQRLLEKLVLELVQEAKNLVLSTNLCLGGGVALNCVANSLIKKSELYDNIWVMPVAGDAGNALGAAMIGYYEEHSGEYQAQRLSSLYLGPSIQRKDAEFWLKNSGLTFTLYTDEICISLLAKALSEGKVVATARGRMEFGPRALGNRSIMAAPFSVDIRQRLNNLVKKRESFRPFAPIVKEDSVAKYFRIGDKSSFMTFIDWELVGADTTAHEIILENIKFTYKSKIPAASHIDNSARIQTVNETENSFIYKLLSQFETISGVPILVNTSFNIKDMPIVCNSHDAIDCFLRSEIDILLLDNFIVTKYHN